MNNKLRHNLRNYKFYNLSYFTYVAMISFDFDSTVIPNLNLPS